MAMSGAVLKAAIRADLITLLSPWEAAILTDLDDATYSFENWADRMAEAVAYNVVSHITGSGNATGVDSRGDTHNLALV